MRKAQAPLKDVSQLALVDACFTAVYLPHILSALQSRSFGISETWELHHTRKLQPQKPLTGRRECLTAKDLKDSHCLVKKNLKQFKKRNRSDLTTV